MFIQRSQQNRLIAIDPIHIKVGLSHIEQKYYEH